MRVAWLVVASALLALSNAVQAHPVWVAPPDVSATASPASSPTPRPDGATLLRLMQKAIELRGSVRVNMNFLSTWKGHWALNVTWMDLGISSNTLREVDIWQRVRPNAPAVRIAVEKRELLVAHRMAASREPGRPWYCERLRGVAVKNSLSAFQLRWANAMNLGAENVEGMAVWHVRATGAKVPDFQGTMDLYISQADDTLVQLVLRAVTRLGGANVRETDTESYSRYGEPVNVRLPGQCR